MILRFFSILFLLSILVMTLLTILSTINDNSQKYCKEDLTLQSYSNIYVNAIKDSLTAITSNAKSNCDNIATNLSPLQTNVLNGIQSAETAKSNITTLQTTLTNQMNIASQSSFIQLDSWQSGLSMYFNNVINTNYTNTFINNSGTASSLNTVIVPNINTFITYYNSIKSTSNTGYDNINLNYTLLPTTLSNIQNNLLPILVESKTTLTGLITTINTQISNCSTAKQNAQTVFDVISNYSNTSAIQTALGSVYITAQTNVTNALNSQNTAITALQNGINNNLSSAQIQILQTNLQQTIENYKQAYAYMRFLLDPANITNDITNIDQVISLNSNVNNANYLNTFLSYLVENNIKFENIDVFKPVYTNLKNFKNIPVNINNNIKSVFEQVAPVIKNNNISFAQNILNNCNTSNTTLNTLLSNANTTLTVINNTISSINSSINRANSILTTNNSMILANTRTIINTLSKHVIEILNSPKIVSNSPNIISTYYIPYVNYYNYGSVETNNPFQTKIYTVKTAGILLSAYFFATITTSSCAWPASNQCYRPYINFYIVNIYGQITFFGILNITQTEFYKTIGQEITIQTYTQVYPGDSVYIFVSQGNGALVCCNVFATNLQLMLDIQI
jgi:hypothetical protein